MLTVLVIASLLILLSVGVHYNALTHLSSFLQHRDVHVRRWVAVGILVILLAHVLEIAMFAIAYEHLHDYGQFGTLIGATTHENTSDYWYYSFVTYTSLGFGDIVPTEALRLLTGLETLTGLILIAWSASFIYMQMQRFWDRSASEE